MDGARLPQRQALAADAKADPRTKEAVGAGLQWLAKHQSADGHWSLDGFHRDGKCNCQDAGRKDDVAGTGVAMLPFLGAGYTHRGKNDAHAQTVKQAIIWLAKHQKADGELSDDPQAQALGTLALCEAYGLTADPQTKGPAQRAVDFLVGKQTKNGGWDGIPQTWGPGASTGVWPLIACRRAELAGLKVPKAVSQGMGRFLNQTAKNADKQPAATAARLLSWHYLGMDPDHANLKKATDAIAKASPKARRTNVEYYLFAGLVVRNRGGEDAERWNADLRKRLIDSQDRGTDAAHAHQKGSWSPKDDPLAAQGGRLMQTALSLLALEINDKESMLLMGPMRIPRKK